MYYKNLSLYTLNKGTTSESIVYAWKVLLSEEVEGAAAWYDSGGRER